MLIPTKAIATAPAISSAPAITSAPASSSALAGLSARKPQSLRESPDPSSRTPESSTVPPGLPLAIPERMTTRLPRKGGYPQTRGGLSLLPRIFRRHQHLPLGCQLRSPECSTRFSQSLYDLAGLFRTPQASLPDSPLLQWVLPSRPTPRSERPFCAAPAHPRTISLYGSFVYNNVTEPVYVYIHGPLPTQIKHTTT